MNDLQLIIGHAQHLTDDEFEVLACTPGDHHVFIDTDPTGMKPLYCLCGEHRWSDGACHAIYYPATISAEEAGHE